MVREELDFSWFLRKVSPKIGDAIANSRINAWIRGILLSMHRIDKIVDNATTICFASKRMAADILVAFRILFCESGLHERLEKSI
jgi:hypothetical protein